MVRMVALLALCLSLAAPACVEEKPLTATEQLLAQLDQAGFSLAPRQIKIVRVKTFAGYRGSECYQVSHHPTILFACFHEFDNGRHALEAGTTLVEGKWPQGRYWTSTVRGRSLVLIDARLQDRPVADKLLAVFRRFQAGD